MKNVMKGEIFSAHGLLPTDVHVGKHKNSKPLTYLSTVLSVVTIRARTVVTLVGLIFQIWFTGTIVVAGLTHASGELHGTILTAVSQFTFTEVVCPPI